MRDLRDTEVPDAEDARRAAPFRFNRIETAVTPDVKHAFTGQIFGKAAAYNLPCVVRMVHRFARCATGLSIDAVP